MFELAVLFLNVFCAFETCKLMTKQSLMRISGFAFVSSTKSSKQCFIFGGVTKHTMSSKLL